MDGERELRRGRGTVMLASHAARIYSTAMEEHLRCDHPIQNPPSRCGRGKGRGLGARPRAQESLRLQRECGTAPLPSSPTRGEGILRERRGLGNRLLLAILLLALLAVPARAGEV